MIFGHTHHSIASQQIDNITYHAKPLGYIREWDLTIDYVNQHPELNPNQTWNLSKRYNIVKKFMTLLITNVKIWHKNSENP